MRFFRMPAAGTIALDFVRKATKKIAPMWSDKRGTSAIEFSFFASLLSVGLLNTVDVSVYVYQRMEVENAAEMGAQAAWKACDINSLPATTNCPGLMTAVTSAVRSTSLGTKVALQSGSPSEGYYCVNSSNALQFVGGIHEKPADCTAAGMPNLQPADYIKISTTFAYQPMFSDMTIARMFATPITKTAWMRLD
jgi:Flp pilus assembly protein TadG